MGAQRGKDLLLKVDPAGGTAFRTVAGLRSRRIAFNAETVDVTDSESAGRWRELLGGAGVQRASLSGSGIFKDAESDAAVRQLFFQGRIPFHDLVFQERWSVRPRGPYPTASRFSSSVRKPAAPTRDHSASRSADSPSIRSASKPSRSRPGSP